MRFDIVTDTFPPDVNGVAMTLNRLRQGLQARGHIVHVIRTGKYRKENGETFANSFEWPGYKEVRMGLPENFKLWDRWKRKRPDAIYVATESMLGTSAVETAHAMGIAVSTGFHTNFQEYFEQYYFKALNPIVSTYLKNFHSKSSLTLAPSQEVIEMLNDMGISRTRLMDRGVDTVLYHPEKRSEKLRQQWGATSESKVLITVGRIATEKNLPLAVRVYRELLKKAPDTKLVFAGDGPIREALQKENPDIIFPGMIEGEILAEHYASSDILLFPSETETFGNVTLEGLASGLVCVGYDYAATEKFIRNGENGFSAPKGDAETYLSRSIEAFESAGDIELRKKARITAEGKGWDKVIDVFENSLKEISKQQTNLNVARRQNKKSLDVRSVFISDLHLGTKDCKTRQLTDFIKHIRCENLYLNGDIFDCWSIQRGSQWSNRDTRFMRILFRKVERELINLHYITGNHDKVIERFMPIQLDRISLSKEKTHVSLNGKKYLVNHGDGFDFKSIDNKILTFFGGACYAILLGVNRAYNRFRSLRGLSYKSISKDFKTRFHSARKFIENYENNLTSFAKEKGYDGIICGHIHTPANKEVNDVHYLNSGDWVESLTAIVEHHDGAFEVISYEDFLERTN